MIELKNDFRAELLASEATRELPDSIRQIIERAAGTKILPGPKPELEKAIAESSLEVEDIGKRLLVLSCRAFDETVRARAAGETSGEGFVLAAHAADAASRILSREKGKDVREIRGEALCSLSSSLAKRGEMPDPFCKQKEFANLLRRAVEAGDEASQAFGERENPNGWARAQCVHAYALRLRADMFGIEAEDEDEVGEVWRSALDAARAAQSVLTMEDAPLDWARIQNFRVNLALDWAELEFGRLELDILARAEAMQLKALEILDRETNPLDWAFAQEQLGQVKSALSETGKLGEKKECQLEEEVAKAFKAALLVRNREDEPELWARNQKRMASALVSQAIMGSESKAAGIYREAIAAYEAALEVYTLEEFDVDFHYCHSFLGDALVYLTDQDLVEDRRNLLERALKSYNSAMRACEDSWEREMVQSNIEEAQRKLVSLINSENH